MRKLLPAIIISLALTACGRNDPPQYSQYPQQQVQQVGQQQVPMQQTQPAPVVVQQDSGFGVGSALIGAAAGYAAANMMNNREKAPEPRTVVQRTVIKQVPAPAPKPAVAPPAPKPVVKSAVKPFSGFANIKRK